jgi:GLPGLI family protein
MLNQTVIGLLLFAIAFTCNLAKAQEVHSEFSVEFDVTGNNPSVNQKEGDFLSYAYKGQKMSMILVNRMVDMHMIYDAEAKAGLLLNSMQAGSVNIAAKLREEDLAYEKKPRQIEVLKGTKKIKGYKCKGSKISIENKNIEVWYSPNLQPFDFDFEGYFFSELDGFPLLMIETTETEVLTSKASKVTLKVEDNLFEQTIPESYKSISFGQLNGGK